MTARRRSSQRRRLTATAVGRKADLYVALAGGVSDADVPHLQDFIRLGGGVLFAGQAWYFSYSRPVAEYPANRVLAPFNVLQWTDGSSDAAASFAVGASTPGPLYAYNADAAAEALNAHFAGTTVLTDAATLATGARCLQGQRWGWAAGRGGT